MATPTQILANRANAALSTGPRTEAGKAASSQNATKHGMTSKQVVLPHEDKELWETFRAGVIESWKPANAYEHTLAVAVAETWWRMDRLRRMETLAMEQRMKAVAEANPDLDPDNALASLLTDPTEMKRMSLLLSYVSAAERAHNRAIAELREVQKARLKTAADAKQAEKDDRRLRVIRAWAAQDPADAPEPATGFVSQPQSCAPSGTLTKAG